MDAAVVLAGGSGSRFGGSTNKVYADLAGRPVLAWSLAAVAPHVDRLLLVTRDRDRRLAEELTGAAPWPVELVTGGASRHESEYAALARLGPAVRRGELDVVALHDGARPLASAALVRAVLATARRDGGAVPGLPLGEVTGTDEPAASLVRVQTPQAFRADALVAAYERAAVDGFTGSDTAACVRRYGDLPVRCVPGEAANVKITVAADLAIAERLAGQNGG